MTSLEHFNQTYYMILALTSLVLLVFIAGVRIVPQSKAYVIERLGGYNRTWKVGFHAKLPFIERIAKIVSLKEDFFDYEPQPVITKDNVTILVDTIVFYQISDPKLYTYGSENPKASIDNLTTTTLRNIIGTLELDQTLTSRDTINNELRSILDEASDTWGIKVTRVEVKNIKPPETIRDAMEKQMRAERERRAAILEAEGKKQAAILTAEGEKQARILKASAEKEASIQTAQGQAEAILAVQKATAEGFEMIKASIGLDGVIKLEGFKTLEKVADGKATKIIIPSDLQNLASLTTSLAEIAQTKHNPT
jgi:regulator of protease activity HflC (stomatin/prohibitin superfamily)